MDTIIADFFTQCKYENNDSVIITGTGSEVVPIKEEHVTKTYDEQYDKIVYRPVNYIMRHKVKKEKFKITTESGKSVIVTGDHSCMVVRNNELIAVKAKDINPETDKFITVE